MVTRGPCVLCVLALAACGGQVQQRPADAAAEAAAADGGADAVAPPDGAAPDAPDAAPPVDGGHDTGPPPPVQLALVRFETVASDAERGEVPPGAPGNGWGGHQSRLARLSTGEVYATYLVSPTSGTDPSQAQWVLVRRGADDADGWSEVARQRCGREPMHLVRLPDDRLLIVSWPGTPAEWSVTPGASPSVVGPTPIPGGWETMAGSSTPYSGVGVGGDGHLCLIASRGVAGTVAGAVYTADSAWDFACRAPDGTWGAFTSLPIGLRFCYPYVVPRPGGAWELVATRDVRWEAAGYTQPSGSFSYVFNAVDHWSFDAAGDTSPARAELGRLEPSAGTSAVSYTASEAMIDHLGRLHVLTRSRTSDNVWAMEHLLVDGAGGVVRAPVEVGGYTDGAIRLVQDDYHRFVLLFFQSQDIWAFPTTDADGLVLGPVTSFSEEILGTDLANQSWSYYAAARGGTPPGRFVDLLLELTDGGGAVTLRYLRLSLY
jgi:hypothetical protein